MPRTLRLTRAREALDQPERADRERRLLTGEPVDAVGDVPVDEPVRGELVGNFPQAFSHVGLIQAAIALDMPEESMSVQAPAAAAVD